MGFVRLTESGCGRGNAAFPYLLQLPPGLGGTASTDDGKDRFTKIPFPSASFGAEQALLNSELLDLGRPAIQFLCQETVNFGSLLIGTYEQGAASRNIVVQALSSHFSVHKGHKRFLPPARYLLRLSYRRTEPSP
jgi:hypothetical protein